MESNQSSKQCIQNDGTSNENERRRQMMMVHRKHNSSGRRHILAQSPAPYFPVRSASKSNIFSGRIAVERGFMIPPRTGSTQPARNTRFSVSKSQLVHASTIAPVLEKSGNVRSELHKSKSWASPRRIGKMDKSLAPKRELSVQNVTEPSSPSRILKGKAKVRRILNPLTSCRGLANEGQKQELDMISVNSIRSRTSNVEKESRQSIVTPNFQKNGTNGECHKRFASSSLSSFSAHELHNARKRGTPSRANKDIQIPRIVLPPGQRIDDGGDECQKTYHRTLPKRSVSCKSSAERSPQCKAAISTMNRSNHFPDTSVELQSNNVFVESPSAIKNASSSDDSYASMLLGRLRKPVPVSNDIIISTTCTDKTISSPKKALFRVARKSKDITMSASDHSHSSFLQRKSSFLFPVKKNVTQTTTTTSPFPSKLDIGETIHSPYRSNINGRRRQHGALTSNTEGQILQSPQDAIAFNSLHTSSCEVHPMSYSNHKDLKSSASLQDMKVNSQSLVGRKFKMYEKGCKTNMFELDRSFSSLQSKMKQIQKIEDIVVDPPLQPVQYSPTCFDLQDKEQCQADLDEPEAETRISDEICASGCERSEDTSGSDSESAVMVASIIGRLTRVSIESRLATAPSSSQEDELCSPSNCSDDINVDSDHKSSTQVESDIVTIIPGPFNNSGETPAQQQLMDLNLTASSNVDEKLLDAEFSTWTSASPSPTRFKSRSWHDNDSQKSGTHRPNIGFVHNRHGTTTAVSTFLHQDFLVTGTSTQETSVRSLLTMSTGCRSFSISSPFQSRDGLKRTYSGSSIHFHHRNESRSVTTATGSFMSYGSTAFELDCLEASSIPVFSNGSHYFAAEGSNRVPIQHQQRQSKHSRHLRRSLVHLRPNNPMGDCLAKQASAGFNNHSNSHFSSRQNSIQSVQSFATHSLAVESSSPSQASSITDASPPKLTSTTHPRLNIRHPTSSNMESNLGSARSAHGQTVHFHHHHHHHHHHHGPMASSNTSCQTQASDGCMHPVQQPYFLATTNLPMHQNGPCMASPTASIISLADSTLQLAIGTSAGATPNLTSFSPAPQLFQNHQQKAMAMPSYDARYSLIKCTENQTAMYDSSDSLHFISSNHQQYASTGIGGGWNPTSNAFTPYQRH